MKATDLKINDIVTYHHEVVTILSVSESFAKIRFQDGELTTAPLNQIKPCEILYKILKMNNFKTIHFDSILVTEITKEDNDILQLVIGSIFSDKYAIHLYNTSTNNVTAMHLCDIKYMHELQHIMAIFGKEISL